MFCDVRLGQAAGTKKRLANTRADFTHVGAIGWLAGGVVRAEIFPTQNAKNWIQSDDLSDHRLPCFIDRNRGLLSLKWLVPLSVGTAGPVLEKLTVPLKDLFYEMVTDALERFQPPPGSFS